jgi:hypothetical protein
MEVFVENLYAIHSIEYRAIDHHFYVFGIREHDHWLSWEASLFTPPAAATWTPMTPSAASPLPWKAL